MFVDYNNEDRLIKPWNEGKVSEDLPADLQDFFSIFDAEPKFKVTIQSFSNEMYSGRPSVIGEFTNEVPNYEKLVKMNGASYYRYVITYVKDGISKKENIDINLTSPNWTEIARLGDHERKAKKREALKDDLEEKAMIMAHIPQANQKNETLADQIAGIKPILDIIGVGKNSDDTGLNSTQLMMFMMKQQQESRQTMLTLITALAPTIIPLIFNRKGDDMSDKLFNMAERMIGFKNMISPKEETLIDKIGGFLGSHMDVIMELLQKPKEVREQSAMYKKVDEDWRTKKIRQKMQSNEEFAKKLIDHLDTKLKDKSVTDELLNGFLKYKRPSGEPEEVEAQEVSAGEITEEDFE